MKSFNDVQKWIKFELKQPVTTVPPTENFFILSNSYKEDISEAAKSGDKCKVMAAAAAYGGLSKTFSASVIVALTEVALKNSDTSRGNVRKWQQKIFGKSISSSRLDQYGKSERTGGGRAKPIEISAEIEKKCIDIYLDAKAKFNKMRGLD